VLPTLELVHGAIRAYISPSVDLVQRFISRLHRSRRAIKWLFKTARLGSFIAICSPKPIRRHSNEGLLCMLLFGGRPSQRCCDGAPGAGRPLLRHRHSWKIAAFRRACSPGGPAKPPSLAFHRRSILTLLPALWASSGAAGSTSADFSELLPDNGRA
jgi:hypothetical protein